MLLLWMAPNPRFNLNTKKEKTHYMKRLRKAWSNSQRLHINQWHTVSNRPVKLHTSNRGVFLQPGFELHSKGTKIIWPRLKNCKTVCFWFFFLILKATTPSYINTISVSIKCADVDQSTTASICWFSMLVIFELYLSNLSFLKLYLQHNV